MRNIAWLVLLLVTTAVAAEGEKKAFALPDGSKLELSIPSGWKDELKEKTNVQQAADKVKPSAVEPILTAQALPGASAPGYYFVSFAILTNDERDNVKDQALAMLKSASVAR